MALKITSAQKGAGSCQHYTFRVQDDRDNYDETVNLHLDSVLDLLEPVSPEKRRAAVAILWAYYRIKVSGATPASCLNVEIA